MKTVLVTPLDWGLGHATRCMPIIRELLKRRCTVVIAGSGSSLDLLRKEFPFLKTYELIPYNPVYPLKRSGMVWKMASQLPKFFMTIKKEHEQTEEIVQEANIDLIISDNRYGCWSTKAPSVFVTHQSSILMPKRFGLLAPVVRRFNRRYMSCFDQCWVPDFSGGNNLTGHLNHYARKRLNQFKFIGPLSRFEASKRKRDRIYDVAVILSGPEPQRTMLEKIVRVQLEATDLQYCIVRGIVNPSSRSIAPNIFDYLTSSRLQEVIESSAVIIARSGYSTVMDMAALRKKVIFVPTPGQTEQEYLAKTLSEKGIAHFVPQKSFDLQHALNESRNFSGFRHFNFGSHLLSDALDTLLGIKRVVKIS
ncbi:MAG TPA: glycosyltransferase [Chryseosolibacter sp.]